MVYEHLEDLLECMTEIQEEFTQPGAISQASSIERMLHNQTFIFWLTFFHHLMPHVDISYNQLQTKQTDPQFVEQVIQSFEASVGKVRENVNKIIEEAGAYPSNSESKRRWKDDMEDSHRIVAIEICDVIFVKFPSKHLTTTIQQYPGLEKDCLQMELSIVYMRPDFRNIQCATPLLNFFLRNNLKESFRDN
ncbi:hypothetical protein ANN_08511 [Periplaneta americana]|uniref:Uncharacterized protein n=1 Tax=Periplaneta americana TaxID=6978 RepID=A0ABQ8T3V7_PERAM|nr:hypothetical protein ANN_08511 [Periplaneta americana]